MDTDEFWHIIATARARATDDLPFAEALVDVLALRPAHDLLEYQARFDTAHDALYRWDVWAAACLIRGGCSDDSFLDFRAGLIAQGRTWYERATTAPDGLAGHPEVVAAAESSADDALFDEDVNYAAADAYERLTGDPDAFYDAWKEFEASRPGSPGRAGTVMGEDFDFDDAREMRRRLPRLAALFLPGREAADM
ncbi:DUF4240 domain-containing protein [Streptomyces sp. NPDC052015]|uniref:DUF4240 domain-containing protein n=1 Tax=Streptomyces sp. NPDC052015 TaxID=3154755 RepID=UPI003416DF80